MSYAEKNRVYAALYRLKESLDDSLSRRDRAEVMIGACIELGFDTEHLIRKGLRVTGLSMNLVLGALEERTGPLPGEHLWQLGEDKRYRLLDPLEPEQSA